MQVIRGAAPAGVRGTAPTQCQVVSPQQACHLQADLTARRPAVTVRAAPAGAAMLTRDNDTQTPSAWIASPAGMPGSSSSSPTRGGAARPGLAPSQLVAAPGLVMTSALIAQATDQSMEQVCQCVGRLCVHQCTQAAASADAHPPPLQALPASDPPALTCNPAINCSLCNRRCRRTRWRTRVCQARTQRWPLARLAPTTTRSPASNSKWLSRCDISCALLECGPSHGRGHQLVKMKHGCRILTCVGHEQQHKQHLCLPPGWPQALSQWMTERSVLPIENSLGGSIHAV